MIPRHDNGRLHVGALFQEAADRCTDKCGTGQVCFEHMTARLQEVADKMDALILQVQELRKACGLALRCIRERCLDSLTPPGEGTGLYYTGLAADAHDAIEKALGPVIDKRKCDQSSKHDVCRCALVNAGGGGYCPLHD